MIESVERSEDGENEEIMFEESISLIFLLKK